MVREIPENDPGIFRVLFELAPAPILVADDDGRYIEANQAALELLGVAREELLGRTIADFAEPGYDFSRNWSTFVREGYLAGGFPLRRPDGEVRLLSYVARTNVAPGVHVSILRDVTDEKRIEARLRESESQLGQMVYGNPAGILVWNARTSVILMANEAFLSLTGHWRSELIGKTVSDAGLWADPGLPGMVATRLGDGPPLSGVRAPFITRSGERREGVAAFTAVSFEESPAVLCVLVSAEGAWGAPAPTAACRACAPTRSPARSPPGTPVTAPSPLPSTAAHRRPAGRAPCARC